MSFIDWFKKKPTEQLVNQDGQTHSPTAEILHREFDSHPTRGLTPARLANILQAAEQGDLVAQASLFLDMEDGNPHISAEMSKRKMAVKKLDWSLAPPRNATATEKKNTKQLEDLMRDELDLGRIRFDMLDAIGHGYSCLELKWGRTAQGLFFPEQANHRLPTWFTTPQFSRNELRLRDPSSLDGAPLQQWGWIPHLHSSRSGYIARSGLHRVLAWPDLYMRYSARDLAEFLEIYGLPIRIGKYPSTSSDKEKRDLLRTVLSIGHNAAGIIPDSMQLELQNVIASGSADPFKAMIDWCEGSISKAILGGTLTSSTGANGNRSLGDVHNEVRLDIRDDDATQIDQTLSSYLVYPMAILNGWFADTRAPSFVSDTQEPDDLSLFAEALPKLASVGARIPVSYVNRKLKIPEPEGDEPILGAAMPQANSALSALSAIIPPMVKVNSTKGSADPTPGDTYSGIIAADAQPVIDDWLTNVKQLVDTAASLDDLQAQLLNHYGNLPDEMLTRVMAFGLATADLAGRYDVSIGQ